ncbi:hypothetical protein WDZ92_48585, partial [Nostoc sp. NIES-2111]
MVRGFVARPSPATKSSAILRLVDEDVVDAPVELVEHEGGVGARQQRGGAGDEVVEVQRPARHLRRLVAGRDRVGDAHQRHRAVQRLDGAQAVERVENAARFGLQGGGKDWEAANETGREEAAIGSGLVALIRRQDAAIG